MRVDGRTCGFGWSVYDAERCCDWADSVLWADDETAEYFEIDKPYALLDGQLSGRVVKVRKIAIHEDIKLVIINPIEDSDDSNIAIADAIAA